MWQRSTTRRFLRRLFSWRTLRRCLIAAVGAVTLIALFYAVEDWRGRRAWEAHKRYWEAKGEKFSITQLAPSPVPDEQNLALTPLLKPALDFSRGPEGVVWRDTNGWARLDAISADLPDARDRLKRDAWGNLEKGTFADLQAGAEFYRGNLNYPQPAAPGSPAADIRVALGKFDPEISELCEAAAARPYSRFPVAYDYQPCWAIPLRHLAALRKLCHVVQVRVLARLELGQAPEAFDELKLGWRLSDSIRDEPLLISHLVRVATVGINLQTLREGLVRHAWNDAQLAEFEKLLASMNLLAEYKLAMRGERAMSTSGLDWMRRRGFLPLGGENYFETSRISNVMPSGWYYQNMLTISEMFQELIFPTVDENAHRIYPDKADASDSRLEKMRTGPYNIFAKLLMPALSKATRNSARMQTCVDAARIACGLERYRLANGKLPETLDALTPRFIESLPTDVMDGKPLRYHLKSDGGYVVYSIGWNQADDGGQIVLTTGKTPSVDPTRGDWVWQMPTKPITSAELAELH
jgi:hypothetical protein